MSRCHPIVRRVAVFAVLVAALSIALACRAAPARAAAADDEDLDLDTPRKALAGFFEAAEAKDFARASDFLDLQTVPAWQRAARGSELARQLSVVLDRVAWIELAQVSDDPKGKPEDGENTELLATTRLGKRNVPITLTRSLRSPRRWRFSSATVSRIPQLYEEYGPSEIEKRIPPALKSRRLWGLELWQWLGVPVAAILALFVGIGLAWFATRFAARIASRTSVKWDDDVVKILRRPSRLFMAMLVFRGLIGLLALGAAPALILARIIGIVSIGSIAWVAIGIVTVIARWIEKRTKQQAAKTKDAQLRARGVATQVRVLRRVLNVTIGIVALALMLMQFELVRTVGMSLLASAGLAGVVLGFAAQRTFGSLIAGIQLSATQPIRIGDVVIVEGEWGTIEEITLTYVVVKAWDERRLIVPVTRFLEQPFENWTKTSAELHGTVYFYVDWTFPVDKMREELDRIVTEHPKWDGRTKSVVVTDTKERSLEVRALVSAADSSALWELRIDVREKLVRWLQELEGGRYLPTLRVVDRPEPLPNRPGGERAEAG